MFASEMSSTKKKAFTSVSEIEEDQSTEVKNEDNSKYIDMALAKEIEAYFQENNIDHEKCVILYYGFKTQYKIQYE